MVLSAVNLSSMTFFLLLPPWFIDLFFYNKESFMVLDNWIGLFKLLTGCIDDSRDIPYLDGDTELQIFYFHF